MRALLLSACHHILGCLVSFSNDRNSMSVSCGNPGSLEIYKVFLKLSDSVPLFINVADSCCI